MQSLFAELELHPHLLHVVEVQPHEVLFILLYVALRRFPHRPLHSLSHLPQQQRRLLLASPHPSFQRDPQWSPRRQYLSRRGEHGVELLGVEAERIFEGVEAAGAEVAGGVEEALVCEQLLAGHRGSKVVIMGRQ